MNITAVAIVAIICWAIVELANTRKHKSKSKVEEAKWQDEMNQLKERIATLEQIVTDDKYRLKRELDEL
jgi:uncharacterized membrane protein